MAKLKSSSRKRLPRSAFALPSQRKYPIPDRAHAANALARARQQGPGTYRRVRSVVCRRYPSLPACKTGR